MTRTLRRTVRRRRTKARRKDCLATFLRYPARANSPCHYYVVEFDEGILKPGITSDFKSRCRRASKAGHPYGQAVFLSRPYPRAWVWVAEQIILRDTTHHRCTVLPSSLKDYPGKTELRNKTLTAEWIIDRFISLMEEMEMYGFQFVAANHR